MVDGNPYLLSGAISMLKASAQNYDKYINNKLAASSYKTQAQLSLIQHRNQARLLNEQMAQEVWNTYDRGRSVFGQAQAGMAASGFADLSAGDYGLLSDIKIGTENVVSGINRSSYLQNAESERQAYLDYLRYDYAAKSAELTAKHSSGWRGMFKAAVQGGMGALGSYANYKLFEMQRTPQQKQNRNTVGVVSGEIV